MSAECSKCGTDIVYPVGTWPVGECPVCVKDERVAALLSRVETLEGALREGQEELWKINQRHGSATFHVRRALSILGAALAE